LRNLEEMGFSLGEVRLAESGIRGGVLVDTLAVGGSAVL